MSDRLNNSIGSGDGRASDMDCATELCLWPGGSRHDHSNTSAGSVRYVHQQLQRQQETITLFYNGQACVFDLTEVQVKTIISSARRDWDEMTKRNSCCQVDPLIREPSSLLYSQSPQLLISPLFSLKRSLQRFLQERKARTRRATSPYHRKGNCSTYSSSSSS